MLMNIMVCDFFRLLLEESAISTIPENILVTSARPDMVLVGEDEVTLIELTIPNNSMESISQARSRKSEKETNWQALGDLEVKGFVSNLYTIEMGSLRHWLYTSQRALLKAVPLLTKQMMRKIVDEAVRKVIGASQVIFMARTDKIWIPSRALLWTSYRASTDGMRLS